MCLGCSGHHGLQLEQGCSDARAADQPHRTPHGQTGQPRGQSSQRGAAASVRYDGHSNEQCASQGGTDQKGGCPANRGGNR